MASLAHKNKSSTAALLLLAVLGQACVSWPIRAHWGSLKRQEWKQTDSMRKLICFLIIKACKSILIVTQNKIWTWKWTQYVSFLKKINMGREYKERSKGLLTSGGACDASTSLSHTGAVHHHPALIGLLPGLPDNVGCPRCVVIATLSCRKKKDTGYFTNHTCLIIKHPKLFWKAIRGFIQFFFPRPGECCHPLVSGCLWMTHRQVCRSTLLCHYPDRHTPTCSLPSRGVSSRCHRSYMKPRPRDSGLGGNTHTHTLRRFSHYLTAQLTANSCTEPVAYQPWRMWSWHQSGKHRNMVWGWLS